MPVPTKATGHLATLTVGASAWTASLISIGSFEMTRPELECSGLSTVSYEEFLPGDLVNCGEFEIEYYFNLAGTGSTSPIPPISGVAVTIVIDLYNPSVAEGATEGTFTGSGFFTSFSSPEAVSNQIMKGKAKIKWAGSVTWVEATTS